MPDSAPSEVCEAGRDPELATAERLLVTLKACGAVSLAELTGQLLAFAERHATAGAAAGWFAALVMQIAERTGRLELPHLAAGEAEEGAQFFLKLGGGLLKVRRSIESECRVLEEIAAAYLAAGAFLAAAAQSPGSAALLN